MGAFFYRLHNVISVFANVDKDCAAAKNRELQLPKQFHLIEFWASGKLKDGIALSVPTYVERCGHPLILDTDEEKQLILQELSPPPRRYGMSHRL